MAKCILGLSALAAVSSLAVVSESVQAAAITFDLRGSNETAPSISYSSAEGLNLTVTAFDDGQAAAVRRRDGNSNSGGLGVVGQTGPDAQVDGRGGSSEILRLSFDSVVQMLSATFGSAGGNDQFTLIVDGVEAITQGDPDGTAPFGIDVVGQVFDFTVGESNDDYRLQSVEVEAVPEPLTLLGTAAATGIGIMLKRKRSAIA